MPTRHVNMKRMNLADMKPAEYNPRTIDDVSKAGLSSSIKEFGNVQPIIWNKATGNIVGGHQRYNVLTEQGVTETDVVVVDLTEAKEKLLNITLNNSNIEGQFDDVMLQPMLDEIEESSKDVFDNLNMQPLKLPDQGDYDTSFDLDQKERGDLVRMKFMVTLAQKETIDRAIGDAIKMADFPDTGNMNKNGNALERICEHYIT